MSTPRHSKVLIVGSGPAGYTAAIYAARANLKPILVRGLQPGGQLTITTDVENYPGFAEPVTGPWLMEQMSEQAANVGATLIDDIIVEADLKALPFALVGDSGDAYTGDTVIVCTGATARWLGLDSEEAFKGFGVSACATCDGFFFRGKEIAVVGGGDTAAEEALYLTNHATKVTVIHRRHELRAGKVMQDRLFAHPSIEFAWNSVVEEILGTPNPPGVTGLRLKDVRDGTTRELAVEGVFVAIGHSPNTGLFAGQLEIDPEGYIAIRPGTTVTSVPGVFAAGDVQDKVFRQAVTAAGTGCMAAIEAERFLAHRGSVVRAAQ